MKLEENKCPYQSEYELCKGKKCCDWALQNNSPIFFCEEKHENYSYTQCHDFLSKWFHDTQDYYCVIKGLEQNKVVKKELQEEFKNKCAACWKAIDSDKFMCEECLRRITQKHWGTNENEQNRDD